MISECSTLTSLVTTRNPTTSTTGTMMTERSTTTVCRHSHCQQSDNYGADYGEKSAAAVTKAATFSAIVTAWRNHIFLNSRNSNTIDSNCCQGMALNSLRSSATKPPPPSSSSTTRSNQSAKTKGTTAQHSVLSSSASVAATVPLLLCQLDCMSEKTDRTTIERQKEIAAHAAQPSSTITTTTTTTITAYNEEIDNDYASDHYPNNVVECRIPLVNANNEYSGLATQHADETSRLKVFEMMATSSSSSSSLSSTHPSYRPGSKRRSSNGAYSGSKNIWWWQLVLAIYSLVLYISSTSVCLAARQEVASNCSFPSRWEGTWFLSGYQQSVHIRGSQFSYRGKCVASEGNKYLIVNDECHRCLVIYEKHKNVLQFKESECEGDNMYGDQSNPAALAMRSVVKSDHRGGAHPNSNGHPRLSSSDQYIMRSNDDSNDCSFCKRRETLQNLCDQIPGDALLYSLFRENAEPVECPLKGPFSFTYNRGHGECKSPVSNIESCTEDSRLLLSFQACPDVQGTESTVEELTCLATWKDGNSRYLIGLVSQHHSHHLPAPHHALSNEERYRCFVYEKISSMMGIFPGPMSNMNTKDAKYKLAQSGDATCNGLDSAEVGSRIMTLRKPPPAERCDFPAWFKAPRHWRALMGTVGYTFHQSDGSMHITRDGALQTRALCEQINKQTQTEMMAVVHYTSQCDSGFMCMTFYKRDLQVAEIQMGTPASRLEDACAPNYFDLNKMPFVTLLANSLESQMCPLEGLFSLRGAIGPPYITSRHKRNHNNKGHNQHGHHHHEQGHKRHGIQSFRNSEEFGQTSWQSHTRGLSIRSRRAAIAAQPTISGVIQEERRQEHLESGDSKDSSGVDSYQSKSKVFNLRRQERKQQQQKQHQQLQQSEGLRIFASETFQDDGAEGNDDDSDTDNEHNAVAPIIDISSGGRRIEINRMNAESSSFGQQQQQQQQRNRRDVPACMVNVKAQRQLLVGCTDPNLIEVRPRCSEDGEESYYCHGSWTENSTVYIIAKNQATNHGVCISYKQLEGNDGLLVVGDSCYRGLQKPPDNHFVANLTLSGKCGDTSSAYSIHRHRTTTTAQNWIQLTISPIIGGITVFCTMILLNFANS